MKLLARKFIADYKNTDNMKVRKAYGNLTSIVGIINNLLLSCFKFIAGTLANSVSITGDAVNNLSDAGSSIISLISFKLSSKPADEEHPFGHARYECIASMIVACLVLLLGLELIMTSIRKIMNPEEIVFNWLSVLILLFSISIKFWMYSYNKRLSKILKSSIMNAAAADSISDVLATGAVLLSTVISPLIHYNLDGYMGVIVACFILHAGAGIIKSALDELLGKAPDKELVTKIQEKISSYPGVLGMHDLVVHDYGVNRMFASVHVEVDYKEDVLKSHDIIDNIERDFKENMNVVMVIHMDPIKNDDPLTNELKAMMKRLLPRIHEHLSMHDFRIVNGETHTNMIFDVVVPFEVHLSNQEILDKMAEMVREERGNSYYFVVTFDRAYTSESNDEVA